jgi:hypothetical protein
VNRTPSAAPAALPLVRHYLGHEIRLHLTPLRWDTASVARALGFPGLAADLEAGPLEVPTTDLPDLVAFIAFLSGRPDLAGRGYGLVELHLEAGDFTREDLAQALGEMLLRGDPAHLAQLSTAMGET